jgi:hypothetical protein
MPYQKSQRIKPASSRLTPKQESVLGWGLFVVSMIVIFLLWQSMNKVRVVWNSGGIIRISCFPQGVVVTHLGAGEGKEWRVATLPEPFYVSDSISGPIKPEVWRNLNWRQSHGEPMPPPEVGMKMWALYYRPKASN